MLQLMRIRQLVSGRADAARRRPVRLRSQARRSTQQGGCWPPRARQRPRPHLASARQQSAREASLYGALAGRRAERIAGCCADNTKVPQVVFKPDWNRHRNAAPFKPNDQMLEALPIGVIAFPGSGISANLADKTKKLDIPLWRFELPAPEPWTGGRPGAVFSGSRRTFQSAIPDRAPQGCAVPPILPSESAR
jgi:hypothetical protein